VAGAVLCMRAQSRMLTDSTLPVAGHNPGLVVLCIFIRGKFLVSTLSWRAALCFCCYSSRTAIAPSEWASAGCIEWHVVGSKQLQVLAVGGQCAVLCGCGAYASGRLSD
jgi:hypothetical protein